MASKAIELKTRVLQVSDNLPANYIDVICLIDPEYETPSGRSLIRRVKAMQIVDEKITAMLELVSQEYKNMLERVLSSHNELSL